MSEGTVQSGNDTTMPQDLEYLTRHQKIMQLWEEEISAYSSLEAQLNELQEQLSIKDESIIGWKTTYIQCYSEFCHFVEQNKQLQEENKRLQEENKQLRVEIRIFSYLSKEENYPIYLDNLGPNNRQARVLMPNTAMEEPNDSKPV